MSYERKSPEVTAEDHTIYRDVARGASPGVASANATVDAALSQAGSGMSHESGATFHNDATAHGAASALGANAFTAGSDVYFGAGQFSPGTPQGDHLIQHELTHVQQSRGAAAPEPGNFRVSSPGDAAEVEARGGGGGGRGSDSTIYRDDHGPSATPGSGPAAPGGSPPVGGSPTPATTVDPYDAWKAAVQAFDKPGAVTKWAAVPAGSKSKVKDEGDTFHHRVLHVMKKDSVPVIKDGGIDITKYVYTVFLADDFAEWLAPLRTASLLNTFLDANPKRNNVGLEQQHKLNLWVQATGDLAEAKKIFNKLYPPVKDTATLSGATAVAWTLPPLQRLFAALGMTPVGHAQMISEWVLQSGGGGWWEPGTFRVVLPSTTGALNDKDKWTSHRMTGGTGGSVDSSGNETNTQQVSPNYTGPDGTAKTPGASEHNPMTIVHEVGHAVGQRLDGGKGNAYALNVANFPKWQQLDVATWCNELWVNGAAGTGTEPAVSANAKLDDAHAKAFFTAGIQGTPYNPGLTPAPTQADMQAYCVWRYATVPLAKWWDAFVNNGLSKDTSYRWGDETARIKGEFAYGYYTRWGNSYAKHSKDAWDQKVSWYSLSSPLEWFAEQYTHFYRTEKTGSGMDPATVTLMKNLDKLEFAPTTGTDGVTITNLTGSDSKGGGGGRASEAGATVAAAGAGQAKPQGAAAADTPERRPLFFPW